MQFTISFSASGDLQNKARMLSDRDMSRKAKAIGTIRAVAVKLEIRREIGFDALLETGERKPSSCRIEAIWPRWEMTVRNIGPAVAIVAPFKESFFDGDGSARVVEAATAMITGRGGKKRSISSQGDLKTQKSQFFDDGNQDMKDLLIKGFSDTVVEIREGSLTGDAIIANAGETAIVLSAPGIPQDKAEVFDRSNSIKVAKQVEKKKRNGIVARAAEDGVGDSCDRADKREVDDGSNQLGFPAANGTVVVDMDVFLSRFVM